MLLITADDVVIMMTMTMARMMTTPTRRMTMMSMRVTITSRMMMMMKQFFWPQRRCSACCLVTHPKPCPSLGESDANREVCRFCKGGYAIGDSRCFSACILPPVVVVVGLLLVD